MSDDVLDHWIGRLNEGEAEALAQVFRAFEPHLRMMVRRRLSRALRTLVDSGDVVNSAFAVVLAGVRDGLWHFEGRAQLLAFLRRVALRRVAHRYRKHQHALRRERSLDEVAPDDVPSSGQPRPSEEVQGRETWQRLLDGCPPAHREVVRLRKDGFKLAEIAQRTGLHEGSVRRILYDLARRLSASDTFQRPGPSLL
jgi:RNA polymerase sigma-70 factor (ECF subfamily)